MTVIDREYHAVIAHEEACGDPLLDITDATALLALLLHGHCDDAMLMPAGCGEPEADEPCEEARRGGYLAAEWAIEYAALGFLDLRRGATHPRPREELIAEYERVREWAAGLFSEEGEDQVP
jgi:hypothetical protein